MAVLLLVSAGLYLTFTLSRLFTDNSYSGMNVLYAIIYATIVLAVIGE